MNSTTYKRRSTKSNKDEGVRKIGIHDDSAISKISFLESLEAKREDEGLENERTIKRGVLFLRVITCLVLLLLAIAVSLIVVAIGKRTESGALELTFNDSASKLQEGIELSLNASAGCAWTLSQIYNSQFSGGDVWPNVTLSDFENQTDGLRFISKATIAIGFAPMINNQTDRLQWESYAASIGQDELVYHKWSVQDGIFKLDAEPDPEPVYDNGYTPMSKYPYLLTPIWQVSPESTNHERVMYNMHSEPIKMRAIDEMITYDIPTLTSTLTSNITDDTHYNDPSSILFVPVYNGTAIAGSVHLRFSWQIIFSNILPANIKGIVCVLQDSIGNVNTFYIDGASVRYLGDGDLHDPGHESLMQEFTVSIANVSQSFQKQGVNVVTYTISIYPSDAFKDEYSTNIPLQIGLGVLALFFITFPLFILYDCLLHHHLKTLAKSSEIIKSLYPDIVRKRLFQMNEEQQQTKHKPNRKDDAFLSIECASNLNVAAKIKDFLKINDDSKLSLFKKDRSSKDKSFQVGQPIADEFPSVTIMFADIAGFTAWSSAHTPQQVFQLLESLFGQFDRAANKLGVFKVETIGDCYVAVSGLPDPKDDHAVIMSQFALECQRKFNQAVDSLKEIDADTLRLRSGLHSGPITAGILRGQKSRFQLFGDTMNTASRMESTGEPLRVQISEQTAKLLIDANKESWFIPREGLITAKGKGSLQTYWLVPNAHIKDLFKNSSDDTNNKVASTDDN